MADKSKIEWTSSTWNPLAGCSLVSPGCTNCYAMGQAARIERMNAGTARSPHYRGTTRQVNGKDVWTGKVRFAGKSVLWKPLEWRKPRHIFVNSMSDLFHEDVPDKWIDAIFAIMAFSPQHTFQILTKRADRMRAYMTGKDLEDGWIRNSELPPGDYPVWDGLPLPNVWLGISAEDQKRADERIPDLLATPAAVRFMSAEPLLGPLDLGRIHVGKGWQDVLQGWRDCENYPGREERLDWVIVGGESGNDARPMELSWARAIVEQCRAAGVACFVKQLGDRPEHDGRPVHGCTKRDIGAKGKDMAEWPLDLRVREMPHTKEFA